MTDRQDLLRRAEQYMHQHALRLGKELGFGVHGSVFVVESQLEKDEDPARSALKVFGREVDFTSVFKGTASPASAAAVCPNFFATTTTSGPSK